MSRAQSALGEGWTEIAQSGHREQRETAASNWAEYRSRFGYEPSSAGPPDPAKLWRPERGASEPNIHRISTRDSAGSRAVR